MKWPIEGEIKKKGTIELKKIFTLLLTIAVVLAAVASMTACSAESANKKLVGTWEAEWDLTDYMQESLPNFVPAGDMENPLTVEFLDDILDDFKVKDFTVNMELTFDKDGEAELSLDKKSFKNSVQEMLEQLFDKMIDYLLVDLKKTLESEGVTEEAFKAEYNMTLNDYVKAALESQMGITLDKLIEDKVEALELPKDFAFSGKYKLDGDKLYLGEGDGYFNIELEEDELTLKKFKGEDIPEEHEKMMDTLEGITFERS